MMMMIRVAWHGVNNGVKGMTMTGYATTERTKQSGILKSKRRHAKLPFAFSVYASLYLG